MIILLNKIIGLTTNQSYLPIKRFGRKLGIKVGHAGTLDPLAFGLVIVMFGDTKKSYELTKLTKKYIFTVSFDLFTTTGDISFEDSNLIVSKKGIKGKRGFNFFLVMQKVHKMHGYFFQTPPSSSAKKINGQTLFNIFRKNPKLAEDLATKKSKIVFIKEIKILWTGHNSICFYIECGSGTFIRSIAKDIGGVAINIQRIAIGHYTIVKSITLKF